MKSLFLLGVNQITAALERMYKRRQQGKDVLYTHEFRCSCGCHQHDSAAALAVTGGCHVGGRRRRRFRNKSSSVLSSSSSSSSTAAAASSTAAGASSSSQRSLAVFPSLNDTRIVKAEAPSASSEAAPSLLDEKSPQVEAAVTRNRASNTVSKHTAAEGATKPVAAAAAVAAVLQRSGACATTPAGANVRQRSRRRPRRSSSSASRQQTLGRGKTGKIRCCRCTAFLPLTEIAAVALVLRHTTEQKSSPAGAMLLSSVRLLQHLPMMTALLHIPCVPIHHCGEALQDLFEIPSVLAFAVVRHPSLLSSTAEATHPVTAATAHASPLKITGRPASSGGLAQYAPAQVTPEQPTVIFKPPAVPSGVLHATTPAPVAFLAEGAYRAETAPTNEGALLEASAAAVTTTYVHGDGGSEVMVPPASSEAGVPADEFCFRSSSADANKLPETTGASANAALSTHGKSGADAASPTPKTHGFSATTRRFVHSAFAAASAATPALRLDTAGAPPTPSGTGEHSPPATGATAGAAFSAASGLPAAGAMMPDAVGAVAAACASPPQPTLLSRSCLPGETTDSHTGASTTGPPATFPAAAEGSLHPRAASSSTAGGSTGDAASLVFETGAAAPVTTDSTMGTVIAPRTSTEIFVRGAKMNAEVAFSAKRTPALAPPTHSLEGAAPPGHVLVADTAASAETHPLATLPAAAPREQGCSTLGIAEHTVVTPATEYEAIVACATSTGAAPDKLHGIARVSVVTAPQPTNEQEPAALTYDRAETACAAAQENRQAAVLSAAAQRSTENELSADGATTPGQQLSTEAVTAVGSRNKEHDKAPAAAETADDVYAPAPVEHFRACATLEAAALAAQQAVAFRKSSAVVPAGHPFSAVENDAPFGSASTCAPTMGRAAGVPVTLAADISELVGIMHRLARPVALPFYFPTAALTVTPRKGSTFCSSCPEYSTAGVPRSPCTCGNEGWTHVAFASRNELPSAATSSMRTEAAPTAECVGRETAGPLVAPGTTAAERGGDQETAGRGAGGKREGTYTADERRCVDNSSVPVSTSKSLCNCAPLLLPSVLTGRVYQFQPKDKSRGKGSRARQKESRRTRRRLTRQKAAQSGGNAAIAATATTTGVQ